MSEEIQFTPDQMANIEQQVLNSKISVNLTVKQVNGILSILGKYPFDEVAIIVQTLQQEGQPQVRKLITEIEGQAKAQLVEAAKAEAKAEAKKKKAE